MSRAQAGPTHREGSLPASMVSEDVRRRNLSVVAQHLLASGPAPRSRIADATGLTRGSVTALSAVLVDAGVLRESPPVRSTSKGRPVTLLELAADDLAFVAVQLDADQATAVAVTLSGEPLLRESEHHGRPMGRPDDVIDVLGRVVQRALAGVDAVGRRVADLALVVFAPVGGDPAVVLADTDLDWGRVDVVGGLRERVPELPESTRLFPDVTLAAIAEQRLRPSSHDLLYLKSNSGIGGAALVERRIVTGAHEAAGAFGHIPVDFEGAWCGCGQRGCLVTVAGPDVVLEAAGLGALVARDGLTAALSELVARIKAGEEEAVKAWRTASVWIGRVLRILTRSFDPEVIVLGGYWADLVDTLRADFLAGQPTVATTGEWGLPRLEAGALGPDAALVGALWNARAEAVEDPLGLIGKA